MISRDKNKSVNTEYLFWNMEREILELRSDESDSYNTAEVNILTLTD